MKLVWGKRGEVTVTRKFLIDSLLLPYLNTVFTLPFVEGCLCCRLTTMSRYMYNECSFVTQK